MISLDKNGIVYVSCIMISHPSCTCLVDDRDIFTVKNKMYLKFSPVKKFKMLGDVKL